MTTLTITIPNEITTRVVNGFCANEGYVAILENGEPNPETKPQFVKRKIIEYVKNAVRNSEVEMARNLAATQASESVESEVILT